MVCHILRTNIEDLKELRSDKMETIEINSLFIKLDQFLKWAGIADNGAFAKMMIQNGDVKINNEIALQRGKKIKNGDIVEINGAGAFKVIGPSGE